MTDAVRADAALPPQRLRSTRTMCKGSSQPCKASSGRTGTERGAGPLTTTVTPGVD